MIEEFYARARLAEFEREARRSVRIAEALRCHRADGANTRSPRRAADTWPRQSYRVTPPLF